DATGQNPTVTWAQLQALTPPINDGPHSYTVQARADDGQGHVMTLPATTLTVRNTAPAAGITTALPNDSSGTPTSPEGTPITLTGSVTDPSAADTAAGLGSAWVVRKHAAPAGPSTRLPLLQYATKVLGYSSQFFGQWPDVYNVSNPAAAALGQEDAVGWEPFRGPSPE